MSDIVNVLVYKAQAPSDVTYYMIKIVGEEADYDYLVIATSKSQISMPFVLKLPENFVQVATRDEFKIEDAFAYNSYLFKFFLRSEETFYQEDLFEYIKKHSTVEQRDQYADQGLYSCSNKKSPVKNCAYGIWTHIVKGEGDAADEVFTDMEHSCYFCGEPEDCK